jgi:hypothetical protein
MSAELDPQIAEKMARIRTKALAREQEKKTRKKAKRERREKLAIFCATLSVDDNNPDTVWAKWQLFVGDTQ